LSDAMWTKKQNRGKMAGKKKGKSKACPQKILSYLIENRLQRKW